jgi:SOS-response transcriptional repressor LexA
MASNEFRVYSALAELIVAKGYAPTVKEIAEEVGMSQSTVQWHLNALILHGHVARDDGKARTLRILR